MSRYQDAFDAHQRARFMRPDAHRWVRPDAARFLAPGTDPASVYPVLVPAETKYSPNQPRVPAGSGRESGRWTDGSGGIGSLARPMGNIGINDPRVVSDADPDTVRPGQQYAQNRPRSGGRVLINGQQFELTPAQAARLSAAQARAEEAIGRVREVDGNWKPSPSAYQTPEGLIRVYEAEALQAQARASELSRMGIGPGPFARESIPARGPERNFTMTERDEINRIGFETGCHTCGIRAPGTKRENFVPDHQVPNGLNYGGRSQRLYPQCISCSWSQGGHVNNLKSK